MALSFVLILEAVATVLASVLLLSLMGPSRRELALEQ